MTNSLQDLIDASIFISTEYQARLAELIGSADYDVNFAEQSLTFKAADPVSFQPTCSVPNLKTVEPGFGRGSNWDIFQMR